MPRARHRDSIRKGKGWTRKGKGWTKEGQGMTRDGQGNNVAMFRYHTTENLQRNFPLLVDTA